MSILPVIPIYVISLPRDIERQKAMRAQFEEDWERITLVDAVDGKTLPEIRPPMCRHNYRRPLTPSETACALSHLSVWRTFLESNAAACIILEDDIEGDSHSLQQAEHFMRHTPDDSFVLFGGQQGLRNKKYVRGKPLKLQETAYWMLPKINLRFLARTCCYGVTRNTAAHLLRRQEQCLDRADHWYSLLRKIRHVIITPLFTHPLDLSNSHIETERIHTSRQSLFRRLQADGFFYACANIGVKMVWPPVANLLHYEQIDLTSNRRHQ